MCLFVYSQSCNFNQSSNVKYLLLICFFFGLLSCSENDQTGFTIRHTDTDIGEVVRDASGKEYPGLDPEGVPYCGPFWGRKFCRFLKKYDETIWADAENYYGDFPDITFSNFPSGNNYFISFYTLDSIASYCEGWKAGETTYNGVKWNIDFKEDKEDHLWFDYEYYGFSEEIEYTITYKYEVIDNLLHYSSSEGQSFIFHPSDKNYSKDLIETDAINELDGCIFY